MWAVTGALLNRKTTTALDAGGPDFQTVSDSIMIISCSRNDCGAWALALHERFFENKQDKSELILASPLILSSPAVVALNMRDDPCEEPGPERG